MGGTLTLLIPMYLTGKTVFNAFSAKAARVSLFLEPRWMTEKQFCKSTQDCCVTARNLLF